MDRSSKRAEGGLRAALLVALAMVAIAMAIVAGYSALSPPAPLAAPALALPVAGASAQSLEEVQAAYAGTAQLQSQSSSLKPFSLSNVAGISRYATVVKPSAVRAAPRLSARVVARLGTRTSDGTQELVFLLERVRVEDTLWVRVRLPILPNNTTGWLPRSSLGGYNEVRTHLLIDRAKLRLTLYRSGRQVFTARVGIGKAKWPTPSGRFYVRSRLERYASPFYGPLAFGLSARSAVLTDWPGGGFVGVHGTSLPGLIPGQISHGCVRLRNEDIIQLGKMLPVGTPVTIR